MKLNIKMDMLIDTSGYCGMSGSLKMKQIRLIKTDLMISANLYIKRKLNLKYKFKLKENILTKRNDEKFIIKG